MKTVWFYYYGDNPIKSFFRNGLKPDSGFCFFSNRENVLRHFWHDLGNNYIPSTVNESSWSQAAVDVASLETLERWFKEFLEMEDEEESDYIVEIPLDLFEFES